MIMALIDSPNGGRPLPRNDPRFGPQKDHLESVQRAPHLIHFVHAADRRTESNDPGLFRQELYLTTGYRTTSMSINVNQCQWIGHFTGQPHIFLWEHQWFPLQISQCPKPSSRWWHPWGLWAGGGLKLLLPKLQWGMWYKMMINSWDS